MLLTFTTIFFIYISLFLSLSLKHQYIYFELLHTQWFTIPHCFCVSWETYILQQQLVIVPVVIKGGVMWWVLQRGIKFEGEMFYDKTCLWAVYDKNFKGDKKKEECFMTKFARKHYIMNFMKGNELTVFWQERLVWELVFIHDHLTISCSDGALHRHPDKILNI